MLFPWFDKERFFSLSVVALVAIACSAVTVRPTATLLDDKTLGTWGAAFVCDIIAANEANSHIAGCWSRFCRICGTVGVQGRFEVSTSGNDVP